MKQEVFSIAPDQWKVRIGHEVLPSIWNSKGAALAGLQVELRRKQKKAEIPTNQVKGNVT